MSIELPDGSTHRNIQEQVAQNMADIADLQEILEDYNISDKVIQLSSSSGTLSSDELSIAEDDIAFIAYNDQLYVKSENDGTYIYFVNAELETLTSGTITTITQPVFTVVIATGVYSLGSKTLFSEDIGSGTFDDLTVSGDATISGDLTVAGSIEQSTANETYTPSFVDFSGNSWTRTDVYLRAIKLNCLLHLIYNFYFYNGTGSAISSIYNIGYSSINLSSETASKIYDLNGDTAATAVAANTIITMIPCKAWINTSSAVGQLTLYDIEMAVVNSTVTNQIRVYFYSNNITLPAGSTLYITGRGSLTTI